MDGCYTESVMSYQNKASMSPWRGSYGGCQVSTCNPYCSRGGLVLLHSLSLVNQLTVAFAI
ncbi:hypothetical protein Hdeb2414_s0042g00740511 [Helianthus debilis subsp. tardiflorus]